MHFFQLIFFTTIGLVFLPLAKTNSTDRYHWITCEARDPLMCTCLSNVSTHVTTRCDLQNVASLKIVISLPNEVARL